MAASSGMQPSLFAQVISDTVINEARANKIISYLASDSLKGRGNGRPELLKAALFIGEQFAQDGLQPWTGFSNFYLPFHPFGGSKKATGDQLLVNGKEVPSEEFIYLSKTLGPYPEKTLSDFKVMTGEEFISTFFVDFLKNDTSALLLWTNNTEDLLSIKAWSPSLKIDLLLLYTDERPTQISLTPNIKYLNNTEYNVVGSLKGKKRPDEIVVFSAHYDHEGVYSGKRKDSILNGANDDASGTTALLLLSKYFSLRNDNTRTLLFCAFAGEELGLKGSEDFMNYIDSSKIVANINIEMIGIPQYGKSKAFITGFNESNLPPLLKEGLQNAGIRIMEAPDENKLLFKRSDNFNFAKKHIPAHTIMTSDDDDPCYHQPCDEVKRIKIAHMTKVIKGIAVAVQSLVDGTDTPERIKTRYIDEKYEE